MKSKIKDISVMLGMLIKRSLNIFLKDKMSVFFSLLAPLIVLAVYVLFLADIQVDAVKSNFENVPIDDKLIICRRLDACRSDCRGVHHRVVFRTEHYDCG